MLNQVWEGVVKTENVLSRFKIRNCSSPNPNLVIGAGSGHALPPRVASDSSGDKEQDKKKKPKAKARGSGDADHNPLGRYDDDDDEDEDDVPTDLQKRPRKRPAGKVSKKPAVADAKKKKNTTQEENHSYAMLCTPLCSHVSNFTLYTQHMMLFVMESCRVDLS